MTTTYDLLVNWLLKIGAIDHPGITEVSGYEDPESYLCGAGYDYLQQWEKDVLRVIYMFGPIPASSQDLSLIEKGYIICLRGMVFPTASTATIMELVDK